MARVRLSYYGQRDRDVDVDIGDLFKYVTVSGIMGTGVLISIVDDTLHGKSVNFVSDKGLTRMKLALFFRIEVVQKQ